MTMTREQYYEDQALPKPIRVIPHQPTKDDGDRVHLMEAYEVFDAGGLMTGHRRFEGGGFPEGLPQ